MAIATDAVSRIKNRLVKIGLKDTGRVLEQDAALQRMAELGLRPGDIFKYAEENPDPAIIAGEPPFDGPFFGFKSRRQAMMAAYAGMPKGLRPASLGDAAERVNTLLKNQEPERAARTIGLAIISIPAMAATAIPEANVKRFRRLASGKLRELGPNQKVIDVEADEVGSESTVMYKREEK